MWSHAIRSTQKPEKQCQASSRVDSSPQLGMRRRTGLFLSWGGTPQCSSRGQRRGCRNLSYLKSVKEPFGAQERRWDSSGDTAAEKGLSSHSRENLLVFLSCRVHAVRMGISGTALGASGRDRPATQEGPPGFLCSRYCGRGPHL